jgi:glycine/D-amino acid oxidase-like deaminating enzyme
MHIVVVGAGVFGTWTAFHLQKAGVRVTLVDAYGAGNSRSSSGGESRIIRCGYGPDEIYSRMARRSLDLWNELDAARPAGSAPPSSPLVHRCGVLWLAPEDDPYLDETRHVLQEGDYDVDVLDQGELATRYPHMLMRDIPIALLEPHCGVVMARRAVATLAARLEAEGVEVRRAWIGSVSDVQADAYVFACGPWLPKVFPTLLAGRIRPTRQVVLHFGVPAGDDRFGPQHTPAWVDFRSGIYGVPDLEGRGLKLGLDRHGPPFDPDTDERVIDEESVATARAWLWRRFPAMANAPLLEGRVCQYENTSTGDFIIDRHPDLQNVWIAGGGSGHGFKHGPAVGELVAQMVLAGAPVEERFALATKTTNPARAVY